MAAIIAALLPGVSFAGLTLAQWLGLVTAIAQAEPTIVAIINTLHPVFTAIVTDLAAGLPAPAIAQSAYDGFQTQGDDNAWMNRFGAGTQS